MPVAWAVALEQKDILFHVYSVSKELKAKKASQVSFRREQLQENMLQCSYSPHFPTTLPQ